jgi:hypothetical protein
VALDGPLIGQLEGLELECLHVGGSGRYSSHYPDGM